MAWYYVEAGAQKGPLDDDKFLELVMNGIVKADTLVWREGMKDWTPYAAAAGAAPPATPAPAAGVGGTASAASQGVNCAECGRVVPVGETVQIGGREICATCKPVVVQRMIEGTSSGTAELDPEEMLADLRSVGGYKIDIGSVVSRAFDVVKAHLWPSIGVALLMGLIAGASGMVPIVGVFASWLLTGMIMGGAYRYFLLKARGEESVLNDAFAGFQSPRMKQLLLAGMVIGAPQMLMNLFILVMQLAAFMPLASGGQGAPEDTVFVVMFSGIGGLGLLTLVFSILWTPAYIIIADAPMGFWQALELSRRLVMQRFFTWVGVYIVMGALMLAGVLALCVGIFFVIPMIYVMQSLIWTDIRRQAADARLARSGQAA